MKISKCLATVLSIILFSIVSAASVKIDVQLNPAGSFEIQTKKVSGNVKKIGNSLVAKLISVRVSSFKTGLDLRDKHTKEKLQFKKFPKILITDAKGISGKGKAHIEILGIKKPISFSYSTSGSDVLADFPISLSQFGISGISYMGIGVNDVVKVKAKLPLK